MKIQDSLDPLETLLNMMPDRTSKSNILTPVKIAKEMVDSLPDDVWNSQSKFLDIACKSGIFLYEIQKKLMESPSLKAEFPDTRARRQHILKNQLYGIAMDKLTQLISIRVIYGHLTEDNNIATINRYTDKVKGFTLDQFKKTLDKEFKQKDMKFDVVVGNPPYNNDLYLDFVTIGHKLSSKYTMMITPAKWQAKGGKKNEEFREQIVPYMSKVVYYPDCLDVFAIQDASGVSYYLVEKVRQKECEVTNLCNLQPKLNSIETRDISREQTLWNIGSAVVEKLKGHPLWDFKDIEEKKSYTVNINKQLNISTGTSGAWDWENSCIKPEYVGKGGVLFNKEGSLNVLGKVTVITNSCDKSSGTSINLFTSDSIDECKSFYSWLNSKFIRFLILINIGSLTMMTKRGWRFVPDPGAFDHIFTDEELYKKYNLTEEEINIIESVIKERK